MIKIYGKNCINEAIRAKSPIRKIYILDTTAKQDKNFIAMLNDKNYSYEIADKNAMQKLFGANHQGYGALREDYHLEDEDYIYSFNNRTGARVLLLDGVQDPHNLGAILRSVDAFGIDLVILPKNRSCPLNETAAHVSTGAVEHTKVMYVNSLSTITKKLKDNGFWICGTDASGTVKACDIDKDLNLAIIIGSEGFGMSKTLVNMSDYLITIPMVGHVNSLNASVSCGIVLYDLMKK